MNRFSLNSNIYNSNEIIKCASEIGINLFRKFNNIYIFKTLIPGNNIAITEIISLLPKKYRYYNN